MHKKVKLLIVEDDPTALMIYHGVLKKYFHHQKIDTAESAVEALELFQKHKYDIVLSDVRVPNKDDGIRIARIMCELNPETVVFFLTAESSLDLRSAGLCLEDVLKKPIILKQLIEKIQIAIDKFNPMLE